MATTHPIIARSRARHNHNIIDGLEYRLERYRLLLWGMQFLRTPTSILTRSQLLRIGDVKKATGASSEEVIRRGVDLFLKQEAPVYVAAARG